VIGMDLVAVIIAIGVFSLLLLMVKGIDRI
jgi:hypothetical protein